MKVFGIVFMRALGRCRVDTEAGIIQRFQPGAAGIVTHHCIGTEELEKCRPFDLGLIWSGNFVQQIFLPIHREAEKILAMRLKGERINESETAAELELNG